MLPPPHSDLKIDQLNNSASGADFIRFKGLPVLSVHKTRFLKKCDTSDVTFYSLQIFMRYIE